MERSNSPRNCLSDVWYMTLTNDISVIRKYRMLPLVATGRYSSRALFILISVSAAICSFWLTSRAVVLVTLSTLIRSSSSTREPCSHTSSSHFGCIGWERRSHVIETSCSKKNELWKGHNVVLLYHVVYFSVHRLYYHPRADR